MNENLENALKKVHTRNRLLWYIVFAGILILVLVSVLLYYLDIFSRIPLVNPFNAEKISLIVIFLLAIIIFFIKRSFFTVTKIVEKAKSYTGKGSDDVLSVLNQDDPKATLLAGSVHLFSRLSFIVWFLADLIVLVAFINFVLVPVLQTFLIYSFVGIYSLLINFPSWRLLYKIHNYIYA